VDVNPTTIRSQPRRPPQLVKYSQLCLPSVWTQISTPSVWEKFDEAVNRRKTDNTKYWRLSSTNPIKTVGELRFSRRVCSSYYIDVCEILRFPSDKNIDNIHTLSTNITFISTSFRNRKKARPRRVFWPVSQLFQINVIFTDNVRILCLSCKVKKSKTTANFPENIRNKRHSNRLPWCHLSRSHLYWYSFFSLLNMNQVAEKLYFGEWSYTAKSIQSVQYACLNRSSAG
jgi:hypothetical protein